MNAIEIRGLTKRFKARTAVDHLELTVGQGECFALLGANGAGKTTTVRMLCGLTAPTEGDALVMGHSIRSDAGEAKRALSVSPQETAVAPRLTVRENLVLMARLHDMDAGAAAQRAEQLMAELLLVDRAKDRAGKLSGGLQRRLSIAMALVSDPQVLFLDEPTLGLDVRARRELWQLVSALKQKMTVVLTTHYLEEAEAMADRIGVMNAGRLVALGTVEQIKQVAGKDTLEDAFLALTEEVGA